MQYSLGKSQDGNNNETSLLKKFDDFYKDNKNIENEMYFYRKPRVDKKIFQADINQIPNNKSLNKLNFNSNNFNNLPSSEKNLFHDNNNDTKSKVSTNEENREFTKNYYFSSNEEKIKKVKNVFLFKKENVNIQENEKINLNEEKNLRENLEYKQPLLDSKVIKEEINSIPSNDLNDKKNLLTNFMIIKEIESENIFPLSLKIPLSNNTSSIIIDEKQNFICSNKNYLKKDFLNKKIKNTENSIHSKNSELKFDHSKINKEDLNYYLKFVEFYKNSQDLGSIIIKGCQEFDLLALELLRESNYNISFALKQILYPTIDFLADEDEKDIFSLQILNKENEIKKDPNLYINSALNDLIGSNMQEKSQWNEYVKNRLENKILYSELLDLISIAKKMKIDIPDFVIEEIENSLNFSKKIKRHLSEKNSLNDLIKLLDDCQNFKVKFEEFFQLEETIRKTNSWKQKAKEIEKECINYKILQNMYNEGKNLPVKLENFDNIKVRYQNAQQWQEKFNNLPKHSKTRQQGFTLERCNISALYDLVLEAEKINFSSNEVISLKLNYEKLQEYEERIFFSYEDPLLEKTKDLLQEFIGLLDTLKFTTDIYDLLHSKMALLQWKEKKDFYFINKIPKMKHLRNLIKDANQKNLNSLSEIKIFKKLTEELEDWLDKIGNIFYKDYPDNNKVNLVELMNLYNIGKNFCLKPEEIEHLLNRCEEVIDFIKECQSACDFTNFNFKTLESIKERISKFNIKCEIFVTIENQIITFSTWIEKNNEFFNKLKLNNGELKFEIVKDGNLNLEKRQKIIEIIEAFSSRNVCFYENLTSLIDSVPSYAKKSSEYLELLRLKKEADEYMNLFLFFGLEINSREFKEFKEFKDFRELDKMKEIFNDNKLYNQNNLKDEQIEDVKNPEKNSSLHKIRLNLDTPLNEIENILEESQKFCIKVQFFRNIISLYKSKSWSKIAATEKKMSLSDAESMLKEAHNLNLEQEKFDSIKSQIKKTKEWIKSCKKILNSGNFEYEDLKKFLIEGENLPLITEELKSYLDFQVTLENEIYESKEFLKNKRYNFEEFINFVDKISDYSIIVPEFKILEVMKNLSLEWKGIANKILSSRKLCDLYFKKKEDNIYNKNNPLSFNLNINEENLKQNNLNDLNRNNIEISYIVENMPNVMDIYSEDLSNIGASNKNKNSSTLTYTRKRNRDESKNKDYSHVSEDFCYTKNNKKRKSENLNEINYQKDEENFSSEKSENILYLNRNNIIDTSNISDNLNNKNKKNKNFLLKKMKKAEKLQYENVLSVINSIPQKDKDSLHTNNYKISYKKKTSYLDFNNSQNLPINYDEKNLNLELTDFYLNINNNKNDELSNFKNLNILDPRFKNKSGKKSPINNQNNNLEVLFNFNNYN